MTPKNIGHLFYTTSSFVYHFVAIGEFKLELQSGNAQSGSNLTIFRAVWPWNLTMTFKNNRAPLLCYFKLCASFHSHCEFKLELQSGNAQSGSNSTMPCDLDIWRMTLKNNRAPLQCYFKLCAAFRSHWCNQTWVRVRKRPIWVKFDAF